MLVMLSQAAASAERIAEVLDLPEEAPLPAAAPRKDAATRDLRRRRAFPTTGAATNVEHVSFCRAPGAEASASSARPARARPRLTMLLQRFYPVAPARYYLNGENVDAMDDARLHGAFGVAFQVGLLLSGLHSRQRGSRAQSPRGTASARGLLRSGGGVHRRAGRRMEPSRAGSRREPLRRRSGSGCSSLGRWRAIPKF